MVDDLLFGGIFGSSVVCVVGASAGLSPRRGQVYHRPGQIFSMLEEDLQGGREQEYQRHHCYEAQAQVEQHARRGRRLRVAHGFVEVQADPAQDRGDEEPPGTALLPTRLVVRGSTASPNPGGPRR
jgi:hypothetical protein